MTAAPPLDGDLLQRPVSREKASDSPSGEKTGLVDPGEVSIPTIGLPQIGQGPQVSDPRDPAATTLR